MELGPLPRKRMVVPAMVADLGEAAALFTAAYIEVLTRRYKAPTVTQHLAAIRMLFDWLIVGQVVGQESCRRGARSQARRQERQDAGA